MNVFQFLPANGRGDRDNPRSSDSDDRRASESRVQLRIPLDGDLSELLRRLKASHEGIARALTLAQHGKRVQDDPEVIREQVRGVISATNRALNVRRGG